MGIYSNHLGTHPYLDILAEDSVGREEGLDGPIVDGLELAKEGPVLLAGGEDVAHGDPDVLGHGGVQLEVGDLDLEGLDGLAELHDEPGAVATFVEHVFVPEA